MNIRTRRSLRFEGLSARQLMAADLAFQDEVPALVAENHLADPAAVDAIMRQAAEGEAVEDYSLGFDWYDVNFDGQISPLDALNVINSLNRNGGAHAFDIYAAADSGYWYDVSGDGIVTPLDALRVINWLNRNNGSGPVPIPNVAPRAFEQTLTVQHGSSVSIELQGYDANGDQLTYEVITQPNTGSLTGSGNALTFSPLQTFVGTETFVYQVSDGELTDEATISIVVESSQPTIRIAESTPESANLYVNQTAHIATFALTGNDFNSITFEVETVGIDAFESLYLADENGNRLSADVSCQPTTTIQFTTPYSGSVLRVYTNTSNTPATYGGAVRAVELNGEEIIETFWSKFHRVNPAN